MTDSKNEGEWLTVNGEQPKFTNWSDGEPNNEGGNENYAMFYHKSSAYKWNDGNFGNGTNGDDKTFIVNGMKNPLKRTKITLPPNGILSWC